MQYHNDVLYTEADGDVSLAVKLTAL